MGHIAHLLSPEPHPLKEEIQERGLRLWQIRKLTGISEARLSRMLNGIDDLPPHLEDRLRQAIAKVSS